MLVIQGTAKVVYHVAKHLNRLITLPKVTNVLLKGTNLEGLYQYQQMQRLAKRFFKFNDVSISR